MIVKIVAVIPTLIDDPTETIKSISKQTVKVSKILIAVGSKTLCKKLGSAAFRNVECIYVKPNFQDPLGKRVASALNAVLGKVHLRDYDYLLRVDADTVLPSRFVEENLKVNADYVGKAGYAMLIRMEAFIKFFNGHFVEIGAEDSYVGLKLLSQGCTVKSWIVSPLLKRTSGSHHSWRYYFTRGIEMYKLGYEPLHVFERLRADIRNVFTATGYLTSIMKRKERYDFAEWVFKAQLRRLIYGRRA